MFTLRLYQDDTLVYTLRVPLPEDVSIVGVHAQASWVERGKDEADAFYDVDRTGISHRSLVPWHDVEQIAAWVQGDGTDAQRLALADGIREGRHLP